MQSGINPTTKREKKNCLDFLLSSNASSKDFSVRPSKITRLVFFFFLSSVKSQNYGSIKGTRKASDHCLKLTFVNTRGRNATEEASNGRCFLHLSLVQVHREVRIPGTLATLGTGARMRLRNPDPTLPPGDSSSMKLSGWKCL